MIAVNLRAPIALTRLAAAAMVAQGGGGYRQHCFDRGADSAGRRGDLRGDQGRADRIYPRIFRRAA